MSKVVLRKKERKKERKKKRAESSIDDTLDIREKIIEAFDTPPLIPPRRVHFPSNKQSKEQPSPSSLPRFFSSRRRWRFGSLKRSRWRDPKQSSIFLLCVWKREREKERSEGTIRLERVLPIFNGKKLRGGERLKICLIAWIQNWKTKTLLKIITRI